MAGVVVVGAGQAGSSLVAKLRALGYEGKVTLIGEEHAPPYQRPPLSKKYLLGEMDLERLYLRPLQRRLCLISRSPRRVLPVGMPAH